MLIKMRCAEDFTKMNASDTEKSLMPPYAIKTKIPIQRNVDNPSGDFSDANRKKYAKLADEVETRALGKPLRDSL